MITVKHVKGLGSIDGIFMFDVVFAYFGVERENELISRMYSVRARLRFVNLLRAKFNFLAFLQKRYHNTLHLNLLILLILVSS